MADNKSNEPLILDHEYDGIQELDNPLPGWWLATFYLAILFAAFYVAYYHIGNGRLIAAEYKAEWSELTNQRLANEKKNQLSEADLEAAAKKPGTLALGKKTFQTNCVSCHGAAGEGGIGPNLTDAYWINGKGKLSDIAKVIQDGVSAKGMPPWKALLKPEAVVATSVYIRSLKGTNPPGAKAPQGEKVE